jgi:hypothetical protein
MFIISENTINMCKGVRKLFHSVSILEHNKAFENFCQGVKNIYMDFLNVHPCTSLCTGSDQGLVNTSEVFCQV